MKIRLSTLPRLGVGSGVQPLHLDLDFDLVGVG